MSMLSTSLLQPLCLIDGRWQAALDAAVFDVDDPATGQVIAQVANGGVPEVRAAIAAAERALPAWRAKPARERAQVLRRWYELILEHALFRPGMPPNHSDWTATRRVLVAAERPARFRYFGAVSDDAPRQWHAQWTRTDRLPELVELRSVSSGVAMEGERTVVAAPMRR